MLVPGAMSPATSTPSSTLPLLLSATVGAGVAAAGTYWWLTRRPLDNSASSGDTSTSDCCPSCSGRDASGQPGRCTNGPARADPFDPLPRTDYLSWDDYFMAVAFLSSARSKDPSKQVGACIVDQEHVILGIGYNGFPRGCADAQLPWAKRSHRRDALETKYPYVVHAEANALLNKNSANVAGARVYVTMFPCNECAKLLIQAGIREIIYHEAKLPPSCQQPPAAVPSSRSSGSASSTSARRETRQYAPAVASPAAAADDEEAEEGGAAATQGDGSVIVQVARDRRMAAPSARDAASCGSGGGGQGEAASASGQKKGQLESGQDAGAGGGGATGGSERDADKPDPCYVASHRLLELAGVTLRQHRLQRHLTLP